MEFGYLFEEIILFATDLDLGTCWVGGIFKKDNFENSILLGEGEFIPIVSPVGNKKEKPKLFDSIMRAGAGSNKRRPWSELFFEGNGVSSYDIQKNDIGIAKCHFELAAKELSLK